MSNIKLEVVGLDDVVDKVNEINKNIENIKKLQQEIAEAEVKIFVNGEEIIDLPEDS